MNAPGLRQALAIVTRISCGDADGVGFTQLRRELGDLPAPTLARLLRVLVEEGWVRKTAAGLYACGSAFSSVAERIVRLLPDSGKIMTPVVQALAETTGESAAYAEWAGRGFVFRAKQEMPESFHYIPVGRVNPDLWVNGFGRVCLAHQPAATIDRILKAHAGADSATAAAQLAGLARIRKLTVWVSEEKDQRTRIVAPVLTDGGLAGVIGISVPRQALPAAWVTRRRKDVLAAAAKAAALWPAGGAPAHAKKGALP